MGAHINDQGEFQSDKYPTCPAGKVPLSVKDKTAQDLLWEYAQRRRTVDSEFSDDLETALRTAGYVPPATVAVPARVAERYQFVYPNEPHFNRDLAVARVLRDGPDDLVFFEDGSHCKQDPSVPETVTEKLVRNEPGQRIRAESLPVRVAAPHEMPMLLARKLVEEAREVAEAVTASAARAQLVEELADVAEVIKALCDELRIDADEVDHARIHKRIYKGSFNERLVATVDE